MKRLGRRLRTDGRPTTTEYTGLGRLAESGTFFSRNRASSAAPMPFFALTEQPHVRCDSKHLKASARPHLLAPRVSSTGRWNQRPGRTNRGPYGVCTSAGLVGGSAGPPVNQLQSAAISKIALGARSHPGLGNCQDFFSATARFLASDCWSRRVDSSAATSRKPLGQSELSPPTSLTSEIR